ncbi:hypothetical protein [Nocardia otitidiscaviarum]|uniref:hypothetical protein n=1 Tax=Nocardia otitidiscaviarum TaxID=1823 RepID=UPI0004A7290F|nr:hypothetical protein [Nocardia otitidiscaviarum]
MSGLTVRSRQQKLHRWRRANNIEVYTDPEPVREHIALLMSWGMTVGMIGQAAGCSGQAITYINQGAFPRVKADLARRIRAVDHHPRPGQWFALAVGARRRIEALNALGWQSEYLAERLGIYGRVRLQQMIKQPRIRYATWAAIRDLYNELSGTPGPGRNTMVRARNRGLAAPLAWYGRDIDHPDTRPRRTGEKHGTV